MPIIVPKGRLLVKLDQAHAFDGSAGTVVAVGPKPTGPCGEDMAVAAQKGDKVFFRLMDAEETIQLDQAPHAVIDHWQVRLLER